MIQVFFVKNIHYRLTRKTPYGKFLPGTNLSKNSQVIMTTWSQGMLGPEGSKPKEFFHLKIE
jgi:hypothetical protein